MENDSYDAFQKKKTLATNLHLNKNNLLHRHPDRVSHGRDVFQFLVEQKQWFLADWFTYKPYVDWYIAIFIILSDNCGLCHILDNDCLTR